MSVPEGLHIILQDPQLLVYILASESWKVLVLWLQALFVPLFKVLYYEKKSLNMKYLFSIGFIDILIGCQGSWCPFKDLERCDVCHKYR